MRHAAPLLRRIVESRRRSASGARFWQVNRALRPRFPGISRLLTVPMVKDRPPRPENQVIRPMDFSNATILCLGDIMLDRFAYCDTERISPEAPVPVLLLKRTQSMLGGVGNVARNITALGGKAVLLGLLGRDQAGQEVCDLMSRTTGLVDAHVASANRPTICKTRY